MDGGYWCQPMQEGLWYTLSPKHENKFKKRTLRFVYTEFRNAMYTQINNIEFIDMTGTNSFIYLMKNYWKGVSQYIELAWDQKTNIIYNSA